MLIWVVALAITVPIALWRGRGQPHVNDRWLNTQLLANLLVDGIAP